MAGGGVVSLDLTPPPAPGSSRSAHRVWGMAALGVLEAEVRRLETMGLNLSLVWTVNDRGGAYSVGAYFCLGCSKLHRQFRIQASPVDRWFEVAELPK